MEINIEEGFFLGNSYISEIVVYLCLAKRFSKKSSDMGWAYTD